MNQHILEVKHLKTYFPVKNGLFAKKTKYVKAVDDVSFCLSKGKTLGIVGESGCGKTTMGRSILRLIEPTSGSVKFLGEEITALSRSKMREFRGEMQLIFQDPFSSLNPRITVFDTLEEALSIHLPGESRVERTEHIHQLLDMVGLNISHAHRYPHEFSGGQRQRIGIARAISVNPSLIIADEPISALDVSIQAQILNLLQDLQGQLGLTCIFVTHDLSAVKHISDRIGVMYLGSMVEQADTDDLFSNPLHPYTKLLMSAVPIPDPTRKREKIYLHGDVPSPADPPTGCSFHTRCNQCMDICSSIKPQEIEVEPGHMVACHLYL